MFLPYYKNKHGSVIALFKIRHIYLNVGHRQASLCIKDPHGVANVPSTAGRAGGANKSQEDHTSWLSQCRMSHFWPKYTSFFIKVCHRWSTAYPSKSCTTPQEWGATLDKFLPSYQLFEILHERLGAPACVTGLMKPFLQNKGRRELFP